MIKILIADDHAVVRRGVRQILEEEPNLVIAVEASSGSEVLEAIRQREFDVVLLDMALPDINGLEVLKQLRSLRPALPVLILSMYPEQQYAVRALRAGARGYLTKESAPEELLTAVRKVAGGGKYVTLSLAEALAEEIASDGPPEPHKLLSDREFQVMQLLATGSSVTDIAQQLTLSVKTISTYRSRILEKLRLNGTADIIRYALENNLVD